MQKTVGELGDLETGAVRSFVRAHPDRVRATRNTHVVARSDGPAPGKVGIVTSGHTGHGPGFLGFLGPRMLDAVALGDGRAPASPLALFDALQEADAGAGVVCLLGNDAEDVASVAFATLLASREGIEVASVIARDDIGSALPERAAERRGGTGVALMWRVAGALATLGADLSEVQAVAQRAIDHCGTIACGFDMTGRRIATPGATGSVEMGIGAHGEAGARSMRLLSPNGIAEEMVDRLLAERRPHQRHHGIAVLLSGLGSTPPSDLYTLFDTIADEVARRGETIHRSYISSYFSSSEVAGVSLSMMGLDDELKGLLDMHADCAALR